MNKRKDIVRVTILYDNILWEKQIAGFKPDWGFSCLIEAYDKRIMFDTGGNEGIFLNNIRLLDINIGSIDAVFISHSHFDHTSGLFSFLDLNPNVPVYIPACIEPQVSEYRFIKVDKPLEIFRNIHSTGELGCFEHSLVIKGEKGNVVIVGCSHPGVEAILKTASQFGRVGAIIGGLHDFNQLNLLEDLDFVCPTHCTINIEDIKLIYPEKCILGGVGKVIEIYLQ